MKFTTLERVAESLRTMTTIVTVPEEISKRAKRAIDAMLDVK
jgi:quinolinate synthase